MKSINDKRKQFSIHYKEQLFLSWYKHGRLSPYKFRIELLKRDEQGDKPTLQTLKNWIHKDWTPRANLLDEQVREELEARAVQEKVEMLDRHAKLGKHLQTKGLQYIEDNYDRLTASTAVRMVVEGVKIEQSSVGVGTALRKMLDSSDEDLLKEAMEILEKADVEIQLIEG